MYPHVAAIFYCVCLLLLLVFVIVDRWCSLYWFCAVAAIFCCYFLLFLLPTLFAANTDTAVIFCCHCFQSLLFAASLEGQTALGHNILAALHCCSRRPGTAPHCTLHCTALHTALPPHCNELQRALQLHCAAQHCIVAECSAPVPPRHPPPRTARLPCTVGRAAT